MAKDLFLITETVTTMRRTYVEANSVEDALYSARWKNDSDYLPASGHKQIDITVADRESQSVIEEAIQCKTLTGPEPAPEPENEEPSKKEEIPY